MAFGDRSTEENKRYWDQELELFRFRAPDPNAPRGTKQATGWGFPDEYRPPPDAYEFVAANYKRELLKARLDQPLPADARYSILITLMTLFAWLRTKDGTRWLLHLYGIEEISPHHGYAYFYENTQLKEPEHGLRIYERNTMRRTMNSPTEYFGRQLVVQLNKMTEERRGPARHAAAQPSDGMVAWVASFMRNWLVETKPNLDWPTSKPDRLCGYHWARDILRQGTQDRVWNVIGQMETYQSRVYRIQRPAYIEQFVDGRPKRVQPSSYGVVWTGKDKMRTVPLDALAKHCGNPPDKVDAHYRCSSCGRVMCCTQNVGTDRLCMSCKGTQLERDNRPSLNFCTYRECRQCPEHLRTEEDRQNRIMSLNTSSDRVVR